MSERFYAPDLDDSVREYLLGGGEARHLLTVCRAKVGTEITLFNGRGLRAEGSVVETRKREALIRVDRIAHSPPANPFTLATALPKGDRGTFLVEKAVELGVARLVPLQTERSVAHPAGEKIERFERAVIEACKQCGRDHLMQVDPLTPWQAVMADTAGWLFDPSGEAIDFNAGPVPAIIAIGPEGGWSEEERTAANEAGWRLVRWPGHILRIETAALAAAAWVAGAPTYSGS